MDDKLIKKLAEYGINEDLERPSYESYMKEKHKEWLFNGQTIFVDKDPIKKPSDKNTAF